MAYRVLIVGLGQIGLTYDIDLDMTQVYTHARAISLHPEFELVGGVDNSEQQRALLTAQYGCPAYADLAEALTLHAIDVLVIATTTASHPLLLQQALALSRLKLVLCEKPLAYGLVEARAMVDSCRDNSVALYVNYMRRSDPAVIEIRRRLANGEIAGPIKGICWYSKGFLNNGSHFFNLLEYWLGPMQCAQVIAAGRLWDDIDPEPDVQVSFRDGSVMFTAAREEAFSHYSIELLAANGRLRYEQGGRQVEWQPVVSSVFKGYNTLSTDAEVLPTGISRYQWQVTDQMAAALAGLDNQLCDGRQALATLESMHAILDQRARCLCD